MQISLLNSACDPSQIELHLGPDEDPTLLAKSLAAEVRTLAQQLADAKANPEQNKAELNELLECISLMRVQFGFNKNTFKAMQAQVREARLESASLMEFLAGQREEMASLHGRLSAQGVKIEGLEAQNEALRHRNETLSSQLDGRHDESFGQLLVQARQYRTDFTTKMAQAKAEEEKRQQEQQLFQFQKKLTAAQKARLPEAPVQTENVQALVREVSELRAQLQEREVENEALRQQVEILQEQQHEIEEIKEMAAQKLPSQDDKERLEKSVEECNALKDALYAQKIDLDDAHTEIEQLRECLTEFEQTIGNLETANQQLKDSIAQQHDEFMRTQLQQVERQQKDKELYQALFRQHEILKAVVQNGDFQAVREQWNELQLQELTILRAQFIDE